MLNTVLKVFTKVCVDTLGITCIIQVQNLSEFFISNILL